MGQSVFGQRQYHKGQASVWRETRPDHSADSVNPYRVPPIIDLIESYMKENYNALWRKWSSGGAQYNFEYLCPINYTEINKWTKMNTACRCCNFDNQTSNNDSSHS